MSILKSLVPVVALAVGTYAQCSTTGTLTLTNSADASRLSSCTTFSGSIAIATAAAAISFDDLEAIDGDLVAVPDGMLSTLSAENLERIDGLFSLNSQPLLSSVSMPALSRVDVLDFEHLGPNFITLGFGSLQQINNVTITDTYLTSLKGINLVTAGSLSITINNHLTDLDMQLVNTTGSIEIRGNPSGLEVTLDSLRACDGIYVNNVSTISLKSLVNSTGDVAFLNNQFTSLALPNLTRALSLTVSENPMLSNLSVPLLQVTGSLNMADNDDLSNITYPALARIVGAATINGSFENATFPALTYVAGSFDVHSTEVITDTCSTLLNLQNVFAIAPQCGPTSTQQQQTNSSNTGANGGATSKSAAHQYGAQDTVYTYSIFTALAALFGLLM